MEPIVLNFESKVTPVKPVNDELTLCKCYIMALGKNSHKTNFSKEAVDDAIQTLFNVPVVGHIFENKDDEQQMGGHDKVITKNADGKYCFKMVTVPYGTVPYQDNVHYEDIEDRDGVTRTYLACDIILWTGRYPELIDTSYSNDIYFNHSMEIKPLCTSTLDDGCMNIEKFKFSALCLLGKSDTPSKNVAPTFPSAVVEPYEFSNEQWNQLFEEFQTKLVEVYSSTQCFEKGGNNKMNTEQITAILSEYGIKNVEDLTFAIGDDMTEEALRSSIVEMQKDSATDSAKTPEPTKPEPTEYSLMMNAKTDAICEAVRAFSTEINGNSEYYYMMDYDDNYVYARCHRRKNCGEYCTGTYRYKYSEADSKITVDKDSCEDVVAMYLSIAEAAELDKKRSEYAELSEFKRARLEDDHKKEIADVIAEFEDLTDIDEFKSAVSTSLEFASVDAFREKLYAIRGKYGVSKRHTKSVEDVRIPIGSAGTGAEKTYEQDFMDKYLHKN